MSASRAARKCANDFIAEERARWKPMTADERFAAYVNLSARLSLEYALIGCDVLYAIETFLPPPKDLP